MILFFKMKYQEWKMKLRLYKTLNLLMDENGEILSFADNLRKSIQDLSGEELRDAFINKIAEYVSKKE